MKTTKTRIHIHISENTSKIVEKYKKAWFGKKPAESKHMVFLYPENGRSADEISNFVRFLAGFRTAAFDTHVVTDSLYVLREIYLAKVPVTWHNYNFENDTVKVSNDVDDIGAIHILDRDLEQSDRYMNHEIFASK